MSSQTLLDNLEVIVKNSNGIALIERLFLSLAVNGKMKAVETEYETAEVRKLGDVCDLYQPKTISTNQLIPSGKFPVYGANGVIGNFDQFNHEESEVLVTCRGATCGTVNVSQPFSWINGNAMVVRPKNDSLRKDFLALVLKSINYETVITGTAQPQITRAPLANLKIIVPSLTAQVVVVSTMNSIFGLLAEIETKTSQLELLRSSFRNSAVDAISTAQTIEELQSAWIRIQDNWETITGTTESVESLRMLVLDLAIRGNLTSKTSQMISPVISTQESPFSIPAHWKWCTLQEITEDLGQETPVSEFSYLDVASINNRTGTISEDLNVLSAKNAPSRARKRVAQGCVLFSTVRPYLRNIAIVNREFTPKAIASTAFAVLYPIKSVSPDFLFFCLRSNFFKTFVESKQKGVAYPAINGADLKSALLPIPPLAEQEQIIGVVTNLLNLCDQLEYELSQRSSLADKFSRSITAITG